MEAQGDFLVCFIEFFNLCVESVVIRSLNLGSIWMWASHEIIALVHLLQFNLTIAQNKTPKAKVCKNNSSAPTILFLASLELYLSTFFLRLPFSLFLFFSDYPFSSWDCSSKNKLVSLLTSVFYPALATIFPSLLLIIICFLFSSAYWILFSQFSPLVPASRFVFFFLLHYCFLTSSLNWMIGSINLLFSSVKLEKLVLLKKLLTINIW